MKLIDLVSILEIVNLFYFCWCISLSQKFMCYWRILKLHRGNNDNLNEVFFGMISRYLTTILYVSIEGGFAPNFLGIVDINSFFKVNIPINISIMITYTSSLNGKQVGQWNADENGMDAYFRISKEYNSGISIGYNFSYENYETFELRTFQKLGGETFVKNMPYIEKDFFHTINIGLLF